MDEHAMALNSIGRRGGRLQVRVTLAVIVTLVPLLAAMSWLTLYFQRQDMESLLLEKAEAIAISGAANISNLWEYAIANGDLTREQVFDTNYVRFWTFDPATDPDFEGDPQSLDKYHTQYDAYTDAHWQDLLDAYLTSDDIIFTVALDVNGYIPTHNRRWSSGDGSPATDRTKRIFNDPVGLRAARNTEPVLQQVYQRPGTGETLWDVSAPIYVDGEHWGVFRVGMELTQNQARVVAATRRGISIVVVVVLVLGGVAWGIGHYVAAPIIHLTQVALQMADGDLEQHIEIPNRYEITVLAQAFNTMAAQLRSLLGSLEDQVAARTQELTQRSAYLAASTEVGRAATQILDTELLISQVVDLIRERFALYYVGLFLVDEEREWATLQAGTGEAGRRMLTRGHRIRVGEGMIGWSVANAQPRVALDVGVDAVRLATSELPHTRSEAALPLRSRGRVMGAFTVQSDKPNAFDSSAIAVLQVMADQVAVALDNAQLFSRAQESLEAERRAYGEVTRRAWLTSARARTRGYRSDETGVQPLTERGASDVVMAGETLYEDPLTVALPLQIREQVVGMVRLRKPTVAGAWTEEELIMMGAVIDQLSVALESARLYQDTQQRAQRERLVGEISTQMRASLELEAVLQTAVREMARSLDIPEVELRLWAGDEEGSL